MTPADQARNQAISLEAKKDALSQRQSGDWKVSFTVQGIDMDHRLTQAAMGTRFAMVLVEIGEDEQPVNRREAMRNDAKHSDVGALAAAVEIRPGQNAPSPDRAKRDWRELPAPQQAGIRINEPTFTAYLKENHPNEWRETGEADACTKFILRIESKTELKTNPRAMMLWRQMDDHYQAWKVAEHA